MILSAALILTALAVWLLWRPLSERLTDEPSGSAVLVDQAREGYAHG